MLSIDAGGHMVVVVVKDGQSKDLEEISWSLYVHVFVNMIISACWLPTFPNGIYGFPTLALVLYVLLHCYYTFHYTFWYTFDYTFWYTFNTIFTTPLLHLLLHFLVHFLVHF